VTEALELPGMPAPAVPAPTEELSADRRRTIANERLLAAGVHPATHRPLLLAIVADPEFHVDRPTCGQCEYLRRYTYHARTYVKCAKHRLGESHSAASDVRVGWPACTLFEGNGDS
jgi:hypothetical protein